MRKICLERQTGMESIERLTGCSLICVTKASLMHEYLVRRTLKLTSQAQRNLIPNYLYLS